MAETIPAPVFYSELEASEPSSLRNKDLKTTSEHASNEYKKRETFYIFSEGPIDAVDSQAIELMNPIEENPQTIVEPSMTAHVLPSVPEQSIVA